MSILQSLLILLNAVSLAEKQEHVNFAVFGLTRLGLEILILYLLSISFIFLLPHKWCKG
jgi:hypothetical protein